MPNLDFPASPSTNDTYTYNGITWKYNGEGWATVAPGLSLSDATTSITIASTDGNTNDTTLYPVFVPANSTGTQGTHIDAGIYFDASANTLYTTNFNGLASSATTATTATNATNIAITASSTNQAYYPVFVSATTGNLGATVDASGFTYNPSTNTLTSDVFSTSTNGNVTSFAATGTGSAVSVDTAWSASTYSCAEYLLSISNTTTGRYSSKVIILSSSSATSIAEYAIQTVGTAPSVTLAVGGSAASPTLSVTTTNGYTIKVVRTLVAI